MSLPEKKVQCAIRKKWVLATPEEVIRQAIVHKMIQDLGFRPEGLSIEKALDQMPHLTAGGVSHIPNRRMDLVYFAKDIQPIHDLYPLLLLECKAVPLTQKVIRQVAGYNYYVQAYFIAIANQHEVCLGWKKPTEQEYQFISHLPTCQELLQAAVQLSGSQKP